MKNYYQRLLEKSELHLVHDINRTEQEIKIRQADLKRMKEALKEKQK